jgi:hypothetical protein
MSVRSTQLVPLGLFNTSLNKLFCIRVGAEVSNEVPWYGIHWNCTSETDRTEEIWGVSGV